MVITCNYLLISVTTTWFWLLPNNCLWIPIGAIQRSPLVSRALCEFTLPRSWFSFDQIVVVEFSLLIVVNGTNYNIMNRWPHDTCNPQKIEISLIANINESRILHILSNYISIRLSVRPSWVTIRNPPILSHLQKYPSQCKSRQWKTHYLLQKWYSQLSMSSWFGDFPASHIWFPPV